MSRKLFTNTHHTGICSNPVLTLGNAQAKGSASDWLVLLP
jgi:hypothetical protein